MPTVYLEPLPLNTPPVSDEARPVLDMSPSTPVADFGFHSRDEKPIRPDGDPSVWGAAFRQNNIVASILSRKDTGIDNSRDETEPDYTAWKDIVGTRYEPYFDRFVESNNRRYTDGLKRQIDMETDDRRTRDAAGWRGTLAAMAAGTADIPTLLPGGGFVKAVKGGYSVSRSALLVGAWAGAGAAAQEAGLQATQQIRPMEESAIAVGGSVILGALIGSAGAALLTRGERKIAESAARVLYGDEEAIAARAAATGVASALPSSAGAAVVEKPTREALAVEGAGAQAVVDTLGAISPNTRAMRSPSSAVRRVMDELSENTVYRNMHSAGETTGPAVETLTRVNYNSRIRQAIADQKDIYKAANKAGVGMSRPDFELAVGRALRRGDAGENEFVTKAAEAWRRNVFDPFKDEAIETGLLPFDVTPEGAASYFSRVYDRPRLIAGEADFKNRVTQYYAEQLRYEYDKHAATVMARIADLENELSDLRLAPEQRLSTLSTIQQGLRDLEAKNIDKIDIAERITALTRTAREATEKGDRAAAKTAREEVARLKKEGGKGFAEFVKERSALRARARRVDMNYAGMEARQNRVLQQLSDLEESNIRNMNRLVARGRKLEREASRLDPIAREEKMAEFRTQFNQVLQRSEKAMQRIADARAKLAENAQKVKADGGKVPDGRGVQQPAGGVSETARADQGGVRADTAVGTAVPQARFGQQAVYEVPSVRLSAPEIKADLGVDIPGTLLRELRGEPATVTAWHGTPHDFDRFDMSKIGTGEGAQAYGHGLYFAEEAAVAKGYRDALTRTSGTGANDWATRNPELAAEARGALNDFAAKNGMSAPDDNLFALMLASAKGGNAPDAFSADLASRIKKSYEVPAGSLYQVRINANPDHFLDWDKPLSEQSERVRKALSSVNVGHLGDAASGASIYGELRQRLGRDNMRSYLTGADAKPFVDRLQEIIADTPLKMYPASQWLSGGLDITAAREALPEAKRALWDAVFQDFGKATGPVGPHTVLREAGIPGIKYLDAGSRTAGDGTRNYVVFDDKAIQIIGKDGKPVPLNDYLKGQADAQFVEAIRAKPVTPELKADLTPPPEATGEAAQIVRAAMAGVDEVASTRRLAETDGFKKWFGNSKTVDAEGKPLVLYHGTQGDFDTFDAGQMNKTSPLSFGFHFTDQPGEASVYADSIENGAMNFNPKSRWAKEVQPGANVMPVYVRVENPLEYTAGKLHATASMFVDDNVDMIKKALADAKAAGKPYDGVIIRKESADWPNVNVIVFDNKQIKSATGNSGAFDPNAASLADIRDLETSITKAANATAPEGMRVKQSSIDEITAAVREAAGTEAPKVDAPEPDIDRMLARNEAAEANRIERLNSIARRMEALDAFNPEERIAELKRITDDLAAEVSASSLAKGKRAAMLKGRYEQFSPERVAAREAEIANRRADLERRFYTRWASKESGGGVDLFEPSNVKFDDFARQIADEVYDKIMGKDSAGVAASEFLTPLKAGPLKERTFNVPDALIEDFLESNVEIVGRRYARSMAAQIEMTKRFGRADMADQLQEIADEFRSLREAVQAAPDAKAAYDVVGRNPSMLDGLRSWMRGMDGDALTKERLLNYLHDAEKEGTEDIKAVRDLNLGRYLMAENSGDFARWARNAQMFNYIRVMGGSGIVNAISEVYRPAMVHGLRRFMGDGIAPLLKNLDAVKLSVREAQLAGQVVDVVTHNTLLTRAELMDPYASNTALERLLQNGTNIASKWNGLVYWTDGIKAVSSVMSQNRILDGVAGQADDTRFLAYLGIGKKNGMADRIAEQFRTHGKTIDGVKVANTEAWTDAEAVRTFRAAVSKDVDSIIVTRSVGDVPLFANTNFGKMILQFRTFNIAAMMRVMMRGMQEEKAKFLMSIVAMSSLGMLSAAARSWRGGEERWEKFKTSAQNPGFLIGEGLDNSGIFTIPFEIANTAEKFAKGAGYDFNPIKKPLLMAFPGQTQQGDSTRFASRNFIGSLLGPTAGMIETAAKAAGGNTKAMSELAPYYSYPGMRELTQILTDDSPYLKR